MPSPTSLLFELENLMTAIIMLRNVYQMLDMWGICYLHMIYFFTDLKSRCKIMKYRHIKIVNASICLAFEATRLIHARSIFSYI